MQDLDLYTGKSNGAYIPRFETPDPEYFSRMADHYQNERTHTHKKATRLFAFVTGLCIISFTTGLVLGIKFTGGSDKTLVDPKTREAVSNLSQKVTTSLSTSNENKPIQQAQTAGIAYPKSEYPFVIRVGGEYNNDRANEIARYLSTNGYTALISKSETGYRVYSGPFRTKESAEISLQKIRTLEQSPFQQKAVVLKR